MSISEIKKVNEKIAESVADGFQKIEEGVVGTYKMVEDKFVETFLTREGETAEDAKKRLSEETSKKI